MTDIPNGPPPSDEVQASSEVRESATSYDLLRDRLATVAAGLSARASVLNDRRVAVFAPSPMVLVEQDRVHTEAACVPRDAVSIGSLLLLGYNVPPGLATSRSLADVFALFRLERQSPTDWNVIPVQPDETAWFLADPGFTRDFGEIYRYYADARLMSLGIVGDELRMTFGIGSAESDVRTLRWRMPRPGSPDAPVYLDAYGEDDGQAPATFDFTWTPIGREALSGGRWPHLNVLDTVFIGASKGQLEFRIDDPLLALSEGGRSVGTDRVSEAEADVAEHRIAAARIGDLVLIRIVPYREETERFYAYSRLSRRLERIDAIGRGCRLLPEDQGVVFPGGYLLAGGEARVFATDAATARLIASHRSPNGEDVLYVYRRPDTGTESLCAYNLVRRDMAVPVLAIGYAVFPDGTIVCVRDPGEAQRVHTITIYTSPFCLPELYDPHVGSESVFGRIGNSELVSGISEAIALAGEATSVARTSDSTINRSVYEALIARTTRLLDRHAWISDPETDGLQDCLVDLRKAAGDMLDELATVAAGQQDAHLQLEAMRAETADYLASTELALRDADAFIDTLARARAMLGRFTTLGEIRYIDTASLAELRERVAASYAEIGSKTVDFLSQPTALDGLRRSLDEAGRQGRSETTTAAITDQCRVIDGVGDRLGLLTEIVGSLDVAEVTQRTAVLSRLADLLATRNGVRAELESRIRTRRSDEHAAAFAAAVAVIGQRQESLLLVATSITACDAAVSDLLAELENASMAYGDVDSYRDVLESKRDEVVEAFARRRDDLLREQVERTARLVDSAQRTIATLGERATALADRPAVDTLFSTDPLATRLTTVLADLRRVGDEAKAAELEVMLHAARDNARRTVTDRSELFADGAVQLGRHRIAVNDARFDLRLTSDTVNGRVTPHARLTGTELSMMLPLIDASEVVMANAQWIDRTYANETDTISRALGLALTVSDPASGSGIDLRTASAGTIAVSELAGSVRRFAAANPTLGAEAGIHDEDAARFLIALAPVLTGPRSLRVSGTTRATAVLVRHHLSDAAQVELNAKLSTIAALGDRAVSTVDAIVERYDAELTAVFDELDVPSTARPGMSRQAIMLLAYPGEMVVDADARAIADDIRSWARHAELELVSLSDAELRALAADHLSSAADSGAGRTEGGRPDRSVDHLGDTIRMRDRGDLVAEVCACLRDPDVAASPIGVLLTVEGLRSRGPGIVDGRCTIDVAQVLAEWNDHRKVGASQFDAFNTARQRVLRHLRDELAVDQLRPRVITGFVRNRVVDEVLLPLVGDAIAKQLGLTGPAQGLLLLMSPPGYGKTTLLEYVADLLGFAMVKVNGPAIGSSTVSLDPASAPDSAAAAELVKLNRAFAMGTNTLLLVDDIQHLHPEFLQKFIPLSDATRRVEGVLDGAARTFDFRGKRFVVAMAGNPYTSAGAAFRLPDMLANRADVHNLGDLVGTAAMAAAFAQSYVENACASNDALRPILSEGRAGIEALIAAATTGGVVRSEHLRRQWSSAELGPILKTLRHLVQVRDVLLSVNAAYIQSAQMNDAMRGEPPFLLQGSYRNMTRIAQRIVPVMTAAEVQAAVVDHYRTESQALADAAAWNMAKWHSVTGLTDDDDPTLQSLRERWRASRVSQDPAASLVEALRSIEAALRGDS